MVEPMPPRPEDFQLTPESFARVPARLFEPNKGRYAVHIIVLGAAVIAGHLASGSWPWILASFLGWFLFGRLPAFGILSALLIFPLLNVVEMWYRRRTNPDFQRALSFAMAGKAYLAKKAAYDEWVQQCQEDYWRALSGVAFEKALSKLFRRMGYQVKLTPTTGDGGVDIILQTEGRITVVQCKAHSKRIPIGTARELAASMRDFHADDAIIACLNGVTRPVAEYIKGKSISVLDLQSILELQRQHD